LYRRRFYNPKFSPPISNDLDISSDNLDEYHGFSIEMGKSFEEEEGEDG
jgi:hypothetical protein